ncbi:MAG TPA: hypothetical protein VKG80_11540 [Trebonia sp.]|nr:hypothetical protein [Trebonia sp.]
MQVEIFIGVISLTSWRYSMLSPASVPGTAPLRPSGAKMIS